MTGRGREERERLWPASLGAGPALTKERGFEESLHMAKPGCPALANGEVQPA